MDRFPTDTNLFQFSYRKRTNKITNRRRGRGIWQAITLCTCIIIFCIINLPHRLSIILYARALYQIYHVDFLRPQLTPQSPNASNRLAWLVFFSRCLRRLTTNPTMIGPTKVHRTIAQFTTMNVSELANVPF